MKKTRKNKTNQDSRTAKRPAVPNAPAAGVPPANTESTAAPAPPSLLEIVEALEVLRQMEAIAVSCMRHAHIIESGDELSVRGAIIRDDGTYAKARSSAVGAVFDLFANVVRQISAEIQTLSGHPPGAPPKSYTVSEPTSRSNQGKDSELGPADEEYIMRFVGCADSRKKASTRS
jgi:hypothetical protein